MKMRFREFLESIDSSWEYDETCGDIASDAAKHLAQYDQQQQRIRELEEFCRSVVRYAGNAGDDYLANKARELLEPPR